jgi:hypothetical protein
MNATIDTTVNRNSQQDHNELVSLFANSPSGPNKEPISTPSAHLLLETIRATRESIGDGLDDNELTRLLQKIPLAPEAGFAFLSFSEGMVMLTVPPQDLANWYPDSGWILPRKEEIARAIAKKHGLSLCEPPDEPSNSLFASPDSPASHHHLELRDRRQAVVIAHRLYLKVRLFGPTSASRSYRDSKTPLPLRPDLLEDLSTLYQA